MRSDARQGKSGAEWGMEGDWREHRWRVCRLVRRIARGGFPLAPALPPHPYPSPYFPINLPDTAY